MSEPSTFEELKTLNSHWRRLQVIAAETSWLACEAAMRRKMIKQKDGLVDGKSAVDLAPAVKT